MKGTFVTLLNTYVTVITLMYSMAKYMENKVGRRCVAQGYYWYGPKKGQPKFEVGVFYPMLGTTYTQEMYDEDNGVVREPPKKKRRKRKK